jgi:DNA-binding MarR family transcriptional regulator/N-acetylglutamate synthase-like GNAT family acetyltransferase
MDLIREVGEMAFATRLRRLSDRLMREVTQIYLEEQIDFEARWFPVLFLLARTSPMSVTEIARSLGITHPAVIQIALSMMRRDLLSSAKDEGDDRRRLLALTDQGRDLVHRLEPVWREIGAATQELIAESGGSMLEQISRIEQNLDAKSMAVRVRERLRRKPVGDYRVVPYRPGLRRAFRTLNLEWIEENFEVEDVDAELLADPQKTILDRGGRIFFALQGREAIGTCALLRYNRETWELAKMAVTKKAQGHGVGRALAEAVLEEARTQRARTVFLQTCTRLVAANALYRSLGFIQDSGRGLPVKTYARPTITMKLDLGSKAKPSRKGA